MLSGTNGMSGPPRPRISRASGVEFQLKRVTGMESQHMRATKCALPRKAMGARSQLIVWGSPHQCVQIAGLPDPVGPRVLDFLGAYNLFSVYISPFGMRCPIPSPALYFKSIQHIRFHKFTTGVPSIPDSDDIQMRIWTYAFELLTHEREMDFVCCCCRLVAELCPTLRWTVALHTPVHGILQARIIEWVAISFSR